MDIHASVQDINPEDPLPTVNLDLSSMKMSHLQDFNQSPNPCTPPQETLNQLTHNMAQSRKQNEAHVKLIADLREENR